MKKAAVLFMGLPGAGKGTQAFRLTELFPDFVHFDTGGEIYRRITDPRFEGDEMVQQQKEIYFAGVLNDPQWVADLVAERIRTYSAQDRGLVFSGSPRTLYEAKAVAPILFDAYGKDRVAVLALEVSEETARERSLGRISCTDKTCRFPTTRDMAGKPCPVCGAALPTGDQKDEEWKISQLSTRFAEYRERTVPAVEYLRSLGLVEEIDGEMTPEEVSSAVLEVLEKRLDIKP